MSTASTAAGTRLLDALDLHWYPEAQGNNASGNPTRVINDDISPGVVAARLQAPRSLWDPTYSENSYISIDEGIGPIQLIPRMQGKIAASYPGTKLSFSEYNYGAGNDISGGVAEADVLGIFGKYGVFSANEWPLLSNESFINGGMRMFRNYDAKNGTFGDTAVTTTNSDTVNSSIYASVDSTNPDHLTLVLINKATTATSATVGLTNAGPMTTAAVYQLTSGNSVPQSAGSLTLGGASGFSYLMPAESVTTISMTSNQWLLSTGGSWSATGSWSAGIPDGPASRANFYAVPTGLTSPGTATLDGNHTVGQLTFNDPVSYTIALGTGGTLTINDAGDAAGVAPMISVLAGSHTISAPLNVVAGLTLSTSAGTSLTLSGNITGSGGVVSNGTVTTSGNNDYGPTVVNSGILTITGSVASSSILVSSAGRLVVVGYLSSSTVLTVNGSVGFANGGHRVYSLAASPLPPAVRWILRGTTWF